MNVHRFFIYIEPSVYEGTQWAVFQPHEPLFTPNAEGSTPQNDIDNGRLIRVVGIAPLKPVEFVIFCIRQKRRVAEALDRRGHRVFWS